VASGQFLIDSEANLNAGLQRLETPSQTTTNSPAQSTIIIEGKGIIKAINTAENSVTLQHEPIPILSWPAMTMNFSMDKTVALNQFKIGDQVQFTFKKGGDNTYMITNFKKINSLNEGNNNEGSNK